MPELYDIYLRKSRADRDTEANGGGDTLLRHRTALLELARKMNLTIYHIFEEVVSGETIANRPEMQKLLAEVETGEIAGVLVMEVERLARGNTRDQGIVAETFQYSNTKIITPLKTYDPADESDQEYFEFGLFMSRREYKTINRRLQRGRMASLQEGKYIAGAAPYGYERVKIKGAKGYTLVIIEDKAAVVRHIYDLYLNGLPQTNGGLKHVGSSVIAKQLDLEGIPSPSGGRWAAYTVRDILNNPTYAGYVRWSWRPTVRKVVDGVLTETRPVNKSMSLTEGIHPPIIDRASWQRAQDIMASRAYLPMPGNKTIVNPLAGLLYCSQCGRSLVRAKGRRGNAKDMLFCPNKDCTCKGSTLDDVEAALKLSLKQWLQDYKVSVKPNKRGPRKSSTAPLEKSLEALNRERDTLVGQKGRLYDLLEQGVYSIDVFTQRQFDLATRISQTEEAIQRAQEQLDNERYMNTMRLAIIPRVEHLLDVYDQLETPQEKNEMLKACLEKVIYTKTEGGRYTESNMQLQLYPRITHIPKGHTHIS